MTNRVHFAEVPLGNAGMISSYDRTGGNRDWGDFSAARNGGRIVLADLKGPGSITRIWNTNIPKRSWLFYFDGEAEPRMVLPRNELINGKSPFIKPLAVGESGGNCVYVPIPYKKSLRIELELEKVPQNSRPYYQINYESYPAGTPVKSFDPQLSEQELALVEKVCDFWSDLPPLIPAGRAADVESSLRVEPGKPMDFMDQSGTGIIDTLAFRIKKPDSIGAVAGNRLLRELWLKIYWDGSVTASVEVPLGDFFCNGPARRRLSSLPIRVTDNWFKCGFPMPFRKRARIEVVNFSGTSVEVEMKAFILHDSALSGLPYFHARWNHSMKSGAPYRVLEATGRGHFAGCYLTSQGMDGSWNNLEGDDVFTVDGKTKLYGTGLEDYFNGGWYYKGLYERLLHGLVEKAAMRTSQYRFHLTTPVAFEESLGFTFEFGTANQSRAYMSSVAYWYQDKPVAAERANITSRKDLHPPIDKIAVISMMDELFELERIGYIEECVNRSDIFAELLAGNDYGALYKVRALAYRAFLNGEMDVASGLATLKNELKSMPKAINEIELLENFYASKDNGILSAHSGGKFKLFLDEKYVGAGNSPIELSSYPVTLSPGEHTIRVELTPQKEIPYIGWFSLDLRMHSTNIVTDSKWEYSKTRPEGWPKSDGDDSLWTPVARSRDMLPSMAAWQFAPNAMILTQSGRQLVTPWDGWNKVSSATYLRRRFVQPEMANKSLQSPIKKVGAEGDSVRPEDDTSNKSLD